MECLVASVDHIKFDIEVALDEQFGALPLPFSGMDSKLGYMYKYLLFIFLF
jgi:cleavage and polyadenylation specificity factor subunit 4